MWIGDGCGNWNTLKRLSFSYGWCSIMLFQLTAFGINVVWLCLLGALDVVKRMKMCNTACMIAPFPRLFGVQLDSVLPLGWIIFDVMSWVKQMLYHNNQSLFLAGIWWVWRWSIHHVVHNIFQTSLEFYLLNSPITQLDGCWKQTSLAASPKRVSHSQCW